MIKENTRLNLEILVSAISTNPRTKNSPEMVIALAELLKSMK